MPYNLPHLQLSEMTRLGARIRGLGARVDTVAELAEHVVRLLYDELVDPEGARATALVRFYRTVDYGRLDASLREFGARLMPHQSLGPDTRCLTLLASAGDKPAWNSPTTSVGHRTIPLPSTQVVETIPMVAQLLAQLGIDIASVVTPDPGLMLEADQRTYNVFYVPEAAGSPFIPAQQEFVAPFHIRSVVGFGGVLAPRDVFAVLMFATVPIPRSVADIFRNAAMNLKLALLPYADVSGVSAG